MSIISTLLNNKRKAKWRGDYKIFCLSMQRTGTTSLGEFFKYFGYRCAGHAVSRLNHWSHSWYTGNFEAIFSSPDFKSYQVFEDDPWWCPEFYKVLYHRFPNSKFVLFTRDSDSWFKSMLRHSGGKTIGNTILHCKIYRREHELYARLNTDQNLKPTLTEYDNLLDLHGLDNHYKMIYEMHNREIVDFFFRNKPHSLISCDLSDESKWQQLSKFFDIDVPSDFEIHVNKSNSEF